MKKMLRLCNIFYMNRRDGFCKRFNMRSKLCCQRFAFFHPLTTLNQVKKITNERSVIYRTGTVTCCKKPVKQASEVEKSENYIETYEK